MSAGLYPVKSSAAGSPDREKASVREGCKSLMEGEVKAQGASLTLEHGEMVLIVRSRNIDSTIGFRVCHEIRVGHDHAHKVHPPALPSRFDVVRELPCGASGTQPLLIIDESILSSHKSMACTNARLERDARADLVEVQADRSVDAMRLTMQVAKK